MAAKHLHSLADENPDLLKQIGCMTGILHLFDHQRQISHKRLLAGNSHLNGSDLGREHVIQHGEQDQEMNQSENVYQKQSVPKALSRASFSSAFPSSFASMERSKMAHLETSSFDQTASPEIPIRHPAKNEPCPSHAGRNLQDFRDVVKDSINRDPRKLSVKKPLREESLLPSNVYESNQNIPVNLQESIRLLAKLSGAPWHHEETREVRSSTHRSKEETRCSISKDAHQFSYDGREINRLSFESRGPVQSTQKLKELPRLSLHVRDRLVCESRSASISTQKWPPSVVVKLMGLEALPDSSSGNDTPTKSEKYASSWDEKSLISRNVIPELPNSMKEPYSPRWKNDNFIMTPVLSSKLWNEAAPLKQLDGNGGSSKPGFGQAKNPVKAPYSVSSVYGEIDKRLKELEFKLSEKDLGALKQILEAMQTKGLLDAKKEEPTSNQKTEKDNISKFGNLNHNSKVASQQKFSSMSGHSSSRAYESPIVIMKPAKLVKKSGIAASSVIPMDTRKNSRGSRIVIEGLPRNNYIDSVVSLAEKKTSSRNVRSRPQQISKESSINSMKSSGSLSPRLHKSSINSKKSSGSLSPRLYQKKIEMENQSRAPAPPSDSKQIRRTSNQKASELGFCSGKLLPKSSNSLQCDDQLSDISNESRTLSYQGDDLSLHLDNNSLMDSKADVELTTNERLSQEAVKYLIPDSIVNVSALRCNEFELSEELAKVASDHPSPVSILDASVYGDDEQSPVKQMQGDGNLNPDCSPDEYQYFSEYNDFSSSLGTEINRKKLQNIDNLVEKLRRLNSHYDEGKTDYIALLCENTDPDHRYISEIFLASGLLLLDLGSGLATFQLHHSGHPINPELFFVLEQTKMNKEDIYLKLNNKFHRKLIFDAVNEILAMRLAFIGASSEPWLKQNKLARKNLSAQKILKELCTEIEQFQAKKSECSLDGEDGLKNILWEDVMNRSGSWTDLHCEIPCVVLDLERSIFKDLIDEILIDGKTHLRAKSGRCKQLFC